MPKTIERAREHAYEDKKWNQTKRENGIPFEKIQTNTIITGNIHNLHHANLNRFFTRKTNAITHAICINNVKTNAPEETPNDSRNKPKNGEKKPKEF
jgi:hypothetical protein